MPYVNKATREALDPLVAPLARELQKHDPGSLNYVISRLADEYLNWPIPGEYDYAAISNVIGQLECAKQEFYRRVAVPYENLKLRSSGDVYHGLGAQRP